MAEDVFETGDLGVDDAPILPDGWKEGDDLFADEKDLSLEELLSDGTESAKGETTSNETDDPDVLEALTKGEPGAKDGSSAEEETQGSPPDGAGDTVVPTSRILKLKVNHQEEDFDVNAASDEDLIAALQKAKAFDAMKNDQLKDKYRQTYGNQIDAGMSEEVAKLIAANACNGQTFSLTDDEESAPKEMESKTPEPKAERTDDFRAQVRQLQALYPDMKEMPEQVMKAYAAGADLLSAYSAYVVAQSTKTAASLKKENAVLKHNAASAAKAPVRGVTGGGSTAQKKQDPFLAGFDADNW